MGRKYEHICSLYFLKLKQKKNNRWNTPIILHEIQLLILIFYSFADVFLGLLS